MWSKSKNDKKCSPCCGKDEESPPMPVQSSAKKGLYSGDCVKPLPGTLPSSKAGFLVSFLVDARGGAMTGKIHLSSRKKLCIILSFRSQALGYEGDNTSSCCQPAHQDPVQIHTTVICPLSSTIHGERSTGLQGD